MKKFSELTSSEQTKAHFYWLQKLLSDVCTQKTRFNDKSNGDDLQARIDSCFQQAEENQTPWFTEEYLMNDPYIKECFFSISDNVAESALYLEPGENAVQLNKL